MFLLASVRRIYSVFYHNYKIPDSLRISNPAICTKGFLLVNTSYLLNQILRIYIRHTDYKEVLEQRIYSVSYHRQYLLDNLHTPNRLIYIVRFLRANTFCHFGQNPRIYMSLLDCKEELVQHTYSNSCHNLNLQDNLRKPNRLICIF